MKLPIYLDYFSTTPVDIRVKNKILEYLTIDDNFGNPASNHHYGLVARDAVEKARSQIANLINAELEEIIWTSGATEANNLAIKGAANFYSRQGKHIITCKTEHKSVLATCQFLENQGFSVTYLTPQKNGLLNLDELKQAIRSDTILVSIMYVNNEIGVIQDIPEIAKIVKEKGAILHVDAVQAVGKIPVDVKTLPIDLMSFTAHKLYGPKGIGALYIRHKPKIRLQPQMHGSGHEFGLRSGTLATHQIVGMGEALQIAGQEMGQNHKKITLLRDRLWNGIKNCNVQLNGDKEKRVPHNLNVSFIGIRGEDLIANLKDLAVSSRAACHTGAVEPSHVLKAIGLSDNLAFSAIRFSLGNYTSEEEIDYAITCIKKGIM